jgi:hypothetical protein
VTIDGHLWLGQEEAAAAGFAASGGLVVAGPALTDVLTPPADDGVRTMLASGVYRKAPPAGQGFSLALALPNGAYEVYLFDVEDYKDHFRDMDVVIESKLVASGIGDAPLWTWAKNGPYPAVVEDGTLDIDVLKHSKGDPAVRGLAVFTAAAEPADAGAPDGAALPDGGAKDGGMTAAELAMRPCLWLEASPATTDYGLSRPVVFSLSGSLAGAINLRILHPWYDPYKQAMTDDQLRAWAKGAAAQADVDGLGLDHEGWTLAKGESVLRILYEEAAAAGKIFCDVPKMSLDHAIAGTTTFAQRVALLEKYTHCVAPWSYSYDGAEYLAMVTAWRNAGYTRPIMPMGDSGFRPAYGGIDSAIAVGTVNALADEGLSFCLFAPHYGDGKVLAAMKARYP